MVGRFREEGTVDVCLSGWMAVYSRAGVVRRCLDVYIGKNASIPSLLAVGEGAEGDGYSGMDRMVAPAIKENGLASDQRSVRSCCCWVEEDDGWGLLAS